MQFSYQKRILFVLAFFTLLYGLNAQNERQFPNGEFWSLDVGFGMSGIMVNGTSLNIVIDPKIWLSPALMVGAKTSVNYSIEDETSSNVMSNILTSEGQVYLRWNFLRVGSKNKFNFFIQGGLGLIAAYRGNEKPFDDVTETRGSVLADAALGVTIPLTDKWHIEPQIRGGYPHIWGASLAAGCKFPLPGKGKNTSKTEYIEIIRTLPASEIIKVIKIAAIEFILFGPDVGRYNVGIDRDAQQLNELVLQYVSGYLKENPDFMVRIEGHANPFTINLSEADDLMALSSIRSNTIAEQLRARGVPDDRMVIVAFGGTRNATSEWDVRNRNRRVELMLIQVDMD